MPIDRTFLNGWIDDSGSGVDGTVWNKARITEMLNAIDAVFVSAPLRYPSLLTFPLTAPFYNDFAPPNGPSNVVWLLQGTAAVSLSGIVAEAAGTSHLLINGAGHPITLKNADATSAAINRFTCPGLVDYVIPAWYHAVWVYYLAPVANWVIGDATSP